ncbi:MAG: HD domain-containing protein [Fusobacteria bacterium]|nr:HD domain-containing protein [Fusobacteriota bacterium]
MLPLNIIEKLFSASNIQRWNDHIKSIELTEIDKQSHKAIIAFLIAKIEEDLGNNINYTDLIEIMLFQTLHRIVLTDLRPNIYHKIMKEKGEELNKWVYSKLENDFPTENTCLKDRFNMFLFEKNSYNYERKILDAAHYLATLWEFNHIYQLNSFLYGINDTKHNIENEIEKHYELEGVRKLVLDKKLNGFISIAGQLRFQQRWAQTPRIPKTTVLGHMFFVAMLSFLSSSQNNSSSSMIYNNFFTSLFHDLPEVLTRDIISPIKSSVNGIDEVIKNYEEEEMKNKIYPLLPDFITNDLKYFTVNEFENKVKIDNNIKINISELDILTKYNTDKYNPCSGKMLKICDNLSAFIETTMSIKYGIKSENLINARDRLYDDYRNNHSYGVNFGDVFTYFYNLK